MYMYMYKNKQKSGLSIIIQFGVGYHKTFLKSIKMEVLH